MTSVNFDSHRKCCAIIAAGSQGGMMEIEQRERTKEADDVVERAEQEVANSIRELGEAQHHFFVHLMQGEEEAVGIFSPEMII